MNRFAVAVGLSAALAVLATSPGGGQEKKPVVAPKAALAKKVTISVERVPVTEFLGRAAKDTGAKFVIDEAGFEAAGVMTFGARVINKVAVKDVLLSKVLADTLKTVDATYKAEKDHILITPLQK